MAAELTTPIDEYSGLPYPIAPRCEHIPLNSPDVANDHHGWHPRHHPALRTAAGVALRNSWIQYVHADLHNEGPFSYHAFFQGPELPTDESDIYGRVVLAFAGFVPDHVIDITSRSQPFARPATAQEAAFLRQPQRNNPFGYRYLRYGYDPVREFLLDYVLGQDLSHIKETAIDEFLCTDDAERKVKIGDFLLWSAAEVATDDIRGKYTALARSNLLHPLMPKDPKPLVKWKLGSHKRIRQHVIPQLEAVLSAA